mgnify:CR=1 FL=1
MPKVLLKDVVARIKDKVDKDNTDLKYYIGGEHFDSGEIQITKKGIIKESTIGPAFHMRFQPGDVLLMSRNPHLRKAGIVDFEGICSDVSYVCRTKDENVLMQRFIPFIFQTDHFWKFAEENKKGSTNFFLNWSDFEKYEFELPQIDEQKKLCEMMWAFEDTKSAYKDLLLQTDKLVKSQFIEMFGDPIENEKGWRTIPLLQTGKCKNGMNYSSKDCGVEMHCLGVADFQDNAVIDDMSVLPMVSLKERPNTDYLLQNGDIVFVRSNGNRALVGRSVVVYPGDEPVVYSGFCIRYRKEREELLTDYLLRFFKTDSVRAKMAGRGANIQNLNQQILAALNIPIPPIEMQKEFSVFVKQSDKSKFISFKSQFIGGIQRAFDEGRVTTLGKMVEEERPITYGIVKPGHGCPGGVPVVKVKDMQDGAIDESNLLLTTPELDYQYRRSRLRTGDLLISIRGSVGRLAEIPESLENANITQDTARLTISPQYNKIYVRGVLESPILQWDMEKNIRGVAVKGINIGYLRELKMPVCSRERQDELAMLYQQSDKSKFELKQAIEDINNLMRVFMAQNTDKED